MPGESFLAFDSHSHSLTHALQRPVISRTHLQRPHVTREREPLASLAAVSACLQELHSCSVVAAKSLFLLPLYVCVSLSPLVSQATAAEKQSTRDADEKVHV